MEQHRSVREGQGASYETTVNYTAERGVKLFEDFNHLLTNNDEEKQFVLKVVEANRKSIPSQTTKKSVVDAVLLNELVRSVD